MKYLVIFFIGLMAMAEPAMAQSNTEVVQVQPGLRLRRSSPSVFLVADGAYFYRFRPPAGATQFRYFGQEAWISLETVPDRTGILRVSLADGQRQLVARQGSWQSYVPPTGFFKIGTFVYYRGTAKPPVFEFNVPSGRVIRAVFS